MGQQAFPKSTFLANILSDKRWNNSIFILKNFHKNHLFDFFHVSLEWIKVKIELKIILATLFNPSYENWQKPTKSYQILTKNRAL